MATTVRVLESDMLDTSQRDSWTGSFAENGDGVAEKELPGHLLMLDQYSLLIGGTV